MDKEERDCNLSLVPIFLITCLFSSQYCFAIHNITSSQALSQGQTLISPGQIFEFGFFSLNNSGDHLYVGMWYKDISPRTVIWVANRENPLRATDSAASLKISSNGNLELVDGNHSSVWSTSINVPSNSSVATLLDTGNLIVKDGKSGEKLWQSFDHLGDTFIPGSVFGFNPKTGQNDVLTSWKSDTDPSVGDFVVQFSSKLRPRQFFVLNGSRPHWRSGPWDGLKFLGIAQMDESYQSPFDLVEDANEGTTNLYFHTYNSSTALKVFISSEGVLKYSSKDKSSDWYTRWESPRYPCGFYGVCGRFGVCKASDSPICRCLKGFIPKSDQEWSKGNWTQGCLRKTILPCEKSDSSSSSQGGNQDGFQKISNMKLPDFYEYVPTPFDIGTCGSWCLQNCSCLAYSYVQGIGCLVWSDGLLDIEEFPIGGEDLFIRLAHSELVEGRKSKKIIISVATISSVATLGAILLIGLHRWRANQKRNNKETTEKSHFIQTSDISRDTPQFRVQQDTSELPFFDFSGILVATGHFSTENKLGQGGFGPVYKAWHLWSEGSGPDMVDGELEGSNSSTEAMRCIHVGLLCIQDQAMDRPNMPEVVFMLNNETDRPQPKEPLFTFQRSATPEGEFRLQNDAKYSSNEATMTVVEGR
ncbi:S-locus glycoprotein [Trema orientale]|uniref:S-locus glycoprotein n=1 Tax=Trema orientale TaxID=63057 RepID=A0A2P5EJX1_TREOI|nr:S-locus glycoprotein [Trema orientale]